MVLAGAALLVGTSAMPASAASGDVIVFSNEILQASTYENPSDCNLLPLGAHVLINKTDEPVTVYGDPLCLGPSMVVQPGYGVHVPPASASFSV
ncbi:hypothetical protein GCM10010470_34800 [Saccharopolyspora taberi]|uniref:Uncharacterized protein n=2 Tax=Saccharopolyspora taberi TaxID=60895 RepID=A0ABN3VEH7_9PSEU